MYLFEMHFPSKHARSDKSILVTASYGIYSWCVATDGLDCIYIYIYMPDPISRIWFGSIFPKAWIILCKNQPGSNLDGLVRFWPSTSGLEASWCARITGPSSGTTQLACYQVSTFRLGCVLSQMAQIILCKTSSKLTYAGWLSGFGQTVDLMLADCVRFWPNGSGLEASQCAGLFWSMFPSWSGSDPSCLLGCRCICISTHQCSPCTCSKRTLYQFKKGFIAVWHYYYHHHPYPPVLTMYSLEL